jgi:hypothetical protein
MKADVGSYNDIAAAVRSPPKKTGHAGLEYLKP